MASRKSNLVKINATFKVSGTQILVRSIVTIGGNQKLPRWHLLCVFVNRTFKSAASLRWVCDYAGCCLRLGAYVLGSLLSLLFRRTVALCNLTETLSTNLQNTVDKLVQRANASLLIGTSSWAEQFAEAITVSPGQYTIIS